jgi:glucose-6-phosphate isomerase
MTTQAQQLPDGGSAICLDRRSRGSGYDATGAAQQALEQHLPTLVADRIATRIFAKDHTLWGPEAEAESAVRLGWVEAATVSQALVPGILELRDALKADGVSRIVLCGMGGSSLAP